MRRRNLLRLRCLACAGLFWAGASAPPVSAHETDQFTLPAGRDFADLGRWFSDWAKQKIEAGVRKTNDRIDQAVRSGRSASDIQHLQSAEEIVRAVNSEFPDAYTEIEGLDTMANSSKMMRRYPGLVVGYEEQFTNIFQHVHFPLDPRQIFRIWHASTLKVYGTYLGTDKIGHFTDMGRHYYNAYSKARRHGAGQAAAFAAAVNVGTEGALFSERGAVGYLSAGAYSNADLVANYLGFLFYVNLTEPVTLRGELRTPMLIREGQHWKVAPHIEQDADFFRWFVSDHLNEVLNPSHFESGMRGDVRKAIRQRTEVVLNRYTDPLGNRQGQAWFERTIKDMRTYFGQEYGHHGRRDELVDVANCCFEDLPPNAGPGARNAIGETALHIAARRGDSGAVRRLLEGGMNVNVTIQSGESYSPAWSDAPLHTAVVEGRIEIVRQLLDAGAAVNARNLRGVAPLHRAVGQPEIAAVLLQRGADPAITDRLGRTPLHYAATMNDARMVRMLLDAKADADARDHLGRSALHGAACSGADACIIELCDGGADVNAATALGERALHGAALHGHVQAAESLISHRADVHASDSFGRTALHQAAAAGHWKVADALMGHDADVNARDATGNTALHLAARGGNHGTVSTLLNAEADVNIRNSLGATALHEAAFSGSSPIVAAIVERGADVGLRNARGQTANDVASAHGHRHVSFLVQQTASLTRFPNP